MLFEAWTSDPQGVRFIQYQPHHSIAETEALIETMADQMARHEKYYYVVSDARGDDVGFASLKIEEECRAIIGFVVFRNHRGRGHAVEIVGTLCDWCWSQPPIFRVYAWCDVENLASIRTLEKAGFVREGVLRRWAMHPNLSSEPRDVWSFAKIKEPDR